MIAIGLLTVLLLASIAHAQPFDKYGGDASSPVPGGATGFFRSHCAGQCVLATPEGNAFWIRSVYDGFPNGITFPGKYPSKAVWAQQTVKRLHLWGFNTIGEYADAGLLPVRVYGGSSNPEKMPFIRFVRPAAASYTNRWGWANQPNPSNLNGVKSLMLGLDTAIYTGSWAWRGSPLADIYDPNFEANVAGWSRDTKTAATATTSAWAPIFWTPNTPTGLTQSAAGGWCVGTSIEDADLMWGFKRRHDPHIGWMVLVTAPTQSGPHTAYPGMSVPDYADTKVYSKHALKDFLIAKYGTIAALNAAWGSNYTTFESNGGWKVGTGLLDENGRNPWTRTNPPPGSTGQQFVSMVNPTVNADLDAFLYEFAMKFFRLYLKYLREPGVMPNHMVFTPATLYDSKIPILNAARDAGIDVWQSKVSPYATTSAGQPGLAELETEYLARIAQHFGGPVFFWTTFTSQEDSPFVGQKNNWGPFDQPTQEARGTAYADYVRRLKDWRGPDGVNNVVGIDWWSWTDKTATGDSSNFGLVSRKDNAYNGVEARVAAGTDQWGYPTGGEAADYGDFLGAAIVANGGPIVIPAGTPSPSPTAGATPIATVTAQPHATAIPTATRAVPSPTVPPPTAIPSPVATSPPPPIATSTPRPTATGVPTTTPTISPTRTPTVVPTAAPTARPTLAPTRTPTPKPRCIQVTPWWQWCY